MRRADRRALGRARASIRVGANGPFETLAPEQYPEGVRPPAGCLRVLLNARFIVFECDSGTVAGVHGLPVLLLMVQRLDGRDGITWDELFQVKRLLGYDSHEAVEIYPEIERLVNSANMRHLWVLPPGCRAAFGLDPARAPSTQLRDRRGER